MMIAAALAAAVLYGAGAAVEQRQAAAAPVSSAGRPRLLFLLARQPLWLLGIAVQIGGFAAHAVALRSGPLVTVQMLVSAELIVAVVIVRIWSGRPLGRACWAAALTVAAAVAAFLELTSPGYGHAAGHPGYAAAAGLGAAVTGAGALAAAVAGLRAAGRRRAVLLAVAAGLADSCSAVVTMALSHVASHGLAALAASWTLYALAASGAGNVLLTQTAYQAGQPMITLPVIAAVTPLASAAVGIGLLGEAPGTGLAGGVAAGLAVLITSVALAFLARSAPHPEPRNHRPAHGQHGGLAVLPGAARPGSAPVRTAGRRPPRPPASLGLSRLAMHPHADACRSSHPGTEATTAPAAQALSRTAARVRSVARRQAVLQLASVVRTGHGRASGQAADLIGDRRPALLPDRGEHRRVRVHPPRVLPGDSHLRTVPGGRDAGILQRGAPRACRRS